MNGYRLFRIRELVSLLGGTVSDDTIYREIERGNLVATRLGRVLCIREDELARWIEKRTERERAS